MRHRTLRIRSRTRGRLLGAITALGLVIGIGLVGVPLSAQASASASVSVSVTDAVAQILADTNALRAAGGLAPLVESTALDAVAQNWSAQMYASGSFVHNPNYSTQIPTGWTTAAENIASGYTATTVVEAWHRSSGHYANIMGPYTAIGIGYYEANGRTYFTQDFGGYQTVPSPALASPNPDGSVQIFRFLSPKNSGHFYTASVAERDSIIANYPSSTWTYEGVAYDAFPTALPGTVPLYRFWSPRLGEHFYTASETEKNATIASYPASVWSFEGVAYYVYPANGTEAGSVAVSRFWSPTAEQHFYTASATERDFISAHYPALVWTYEGDTFRVPTS